MPNVVSRFVLGQRAGLVNEARRQDVDGNVRRIKCRTQKLRLLI